MERFRPKRGCVTNSGISDWKRIGVFRAPMPNTSATAPVIHGHGGIPSAMRDLRAGIRAAFAAALTAKVTFNF